MSQWISLPFALLIDAYPSSARFSLHPWEFDLKPVHASEIKAAPEHRTTLRKAARDLVKVDHLLDESGRARVAAALAKCESLNTVYELQNQLQAIW